MTNGVVAGSRIQALDGVRGVAITMVLLFHAFAGVLPHNPFLKVVQTFWVGVDLFFVLSGYLITKLLLEARESPRYFINFYLRRTLRIFPAYYFTLALIFWVFPLISKPLRDSNFERAAPYLVLHLQNWIMAIHGTRLPWLGMDHLWSLAIEEQFYLAWPLLVYLTPKTTLPRLCIIIFALAVIGKFLLYLLGAPSLTPYTATITRLDPLVAGAWVAAISASPTPKLTRIAKSLFPFALVLLITILWHRFGPGVSGKTVAFITPLVAILFAMLIWAIRTENWGGKSHSPLTFAPLVWLGRYSYGIYLLHWPIYVTLNQWVQVGPWGAGSAWNIHAMVIIGVADIILSLIAARLLFELIESPALKLSARLTGRATNPP